MREHVVVPRGSSKYLKIPGDRPETWRGTSPAPRETGRSLYRACRKPTHWGGGGSALDRLYASTRSRFKDKYPMLELSEIRATPNISCSLVSYRGRSPLKEEFEGVTIRTAILDQNWRSISSKSDGSRPSDRARGCAYMQNPLETSQFVN